MHLIASQEKYRSAALLMSCSSSAGRWWKKAAAFKVELSQQGQRAHSCTLDSGGWCWTPAAMLPASAGCFLSCEEGGKVSSQPALILPWVVTLPVFLCLKGLHRHSTWCKQRRAPSRLKEPVL